MNGRWPVERPSLKWNGAAVSLTLPLGVCSVAASLVTERLMRTILTAACLFLLASASAQQDKPASTTPSGKAALQAYVSAWNRHDFEALDKLLAPDAIHEDIAWPSR